MAKLAALPYVRSGVSSGLSANASFRAYQADAESQDLQGMRRQDYLRLYSQTRALRGLAAQALAAPKEQLPSRDLIESRDTITAKGYGSWVAVYQRTSGEADFMSTPFLVKSSAPITPEEAEARALAYLDQEPDTYNRVTLGVGYLGTEHFQPG